MNLGLKDFLNMMHQNIMAIPVILVSVDSLAKKIMNLDVRVEREEIIRIMITLDLFNDLIHGVEGVMSSMEQQQEIIRTFEAFALFSNLKKDFVIFFSKIRHHFQGII